MNVISIRAAAAAAAAATLAIGCTTSKSSSAPPPSSTSAPVVTTAAPTTVAPPTTFALIPQTSPDVAAQMLLAAWHAGDRAAASRVATPAAIATLFAQPPQSTSDRGCQDPLAGSSSCAFGLGGSLLTMHASALAGGWVIDVVTFD